jgi:hypothetical protein
VDPNHALGSVVAKLREIWRDEQIEDGSDRRQLGRVAGQRAARDRVPSTLPRDELVDPLPSNLEACRENPLLSSFELVVNKPERERAKLLGSEPHDADLHERLVVSGAVRPRFARCKFSCIGRRHRPGRGVGSALMETLEGERVDSVVILDDRIELHLEDRVISLPRSVTLEINGEPIHSELPEHFDHLASLWDQRLVSKTNAVLEFSNGTRINS